VKFLAGHARALLDAHPEIELFVGIDQDPSALTLAETHLEPYKDKLVLINDNFRALPSILEENNLSQVDGIFLDIGVSSMQLDQAEKGFSFSQDGPLDMRMDPSLTLTAEVVVNEYSEKDLASIFRQYGEERHHRAMARKIVAHRKKERICTTGELAQLLREFSSGSKKLHPATRVFQALRIFVNDELDVLQTVLPEAITSLRSGGKLGVISFHSLEDRIAKNLFKQAASHKQHREGAPDSLVVKEASVKILTKKPVQASLEEMQRNPRSRSAKMRFVEKL